MTELSELNPEDLSDWSGDDPQLIDIRGADELPRGVIPGMVHIPMHRLPELTGHLDPERPVILYCAHGIRSAQAGAFLLQRGFPKVYHLAGGIEAWAQRYPVAPPEES